MTLNITKKKIEKVLELFNHPQTRKIRKNRGKKRRRNNKSFNRKNGRKNLATSTLKKRGGQASHGHSLSVGGTVGVVLGGQVGGKRGDVLKTIVSKLTDPLKKKLELVLSKAKNKKKALVAFVKQKLKLTKKTDLNEEIDFTDLNDIKDDEFKVTIKDNNNEDIEDDISDISDISDDDIKDIENIIIISNSEQNNQESAKIEQPTNKKEVTKKEEPKPKSNETNTVETKESKEIDTSEMLKVALASNYFTQYGILSGMLKMNQEKDNNNFDVMNFVQDPKLYAEFCNKMGFQFAKTSEKVNEEPVVEETSVKNNGDGNNNPQDNASKAAAAEDARLKAEEDATRLKAEEDARLKAVEDARLKAVAEEKQD